MEEKIISAVLRKRGSDGRCRQRYIPFCLEQKISHSYNWETDGLNAHTHALRLSTPVTEPPASLSLRTTACFRTETFKTLDFL